MNHLIQRSSGFILRMVVPTDLKSIIGKGELRYALKERSLYQAKSTSQASLKASLAN